jgi:hypothetical protein
MKTPTHIDAKEYAKNIFVRYTADMISGCVADFENNEDLAKHISDELAFILCEDLFAKKINPLEYNSIRNELTHLLDEVFKDSFEEDIKKEIEIFEENYRLTKVS